MRALVALLCGLALFAAVFACDDSPVYVLYETGATSHSVVQLNPASDVSSTVITYSVASGYLDYSSTFNTNNQMFYVSYVYADHTSLFTIDVGHQSYAAQDVPYYLQSLQYDNAGNALYAVKSAGQGSVQVVRVDLSQVPAVTTVVSTTFPTDETVADGLSAFNPSGLYAFVTIDAINSLYWINAVNVTTYGTVARESVGGTRVAGISWNPSLGQVFGLVKPDDLWEINTLYLTEKNFPANFGTASFTLNSVKVPVVGATAYNSHAATFYYVASNSSGGPVTFDVVDFTLNTVCEFALTSISPANILAVQTNNAGAPSTTGTTGFATTGNSAECPVNPTYFLYNGPAGQNSVYFASPLSPAAKFVSSFPVTAGYTYSSNTFDETNAVFIVAYAYNTYSEIYFVGALSPSLTSIRVNAVVANLQYDNSNAKLYATRFSGLQTVVQIDTTTGAVTDVYTTGFSDMLTVSTISTYVEKSGQYILDVVNDFDSAEWLYSIDVNTGSVLGTSFVFPGTLRSIRWSDAQNSLLAVNRPTPISTAWSLAEATFHNLGAVTYGTVIFNFTNTVGGQVPTFLAAFNQQADIYYSYFGPQASQPASLFFVNAATDLMCAGYQYAGLNPADVIGLAVNPGQPWTTGTTGTTGTTATTGTTGNVTMIGTTSSTTAVVTTGANTAEHIQGGNQTSPLNGGWIAFIVLACVVCCCLLILVIIILVVLRRRRNEDKRKEKREFTDIRKEEEGKPEEKPAEAAPLVAAAVVAAPATTESDKESESDSRSTSSRSSRTSSGSRSGSESGSGSRSRSRSGSHSHSGSESESAEGAHAAGGSESASAAEDSEEELARNGAKDKP